MRRGAASGLIALVLAACGGGQNGAAPLTAPQNISLTSPYFPDTERISTDITCAGSGRAPAMTWSDPPPTARSLFVELIDTQAPAGIFTHWLVYDIPSGVRGLQPPLKPQAVQGRNDLGRLGYVGPCPPRGQTHIYLLSVYATDLDPDLPAGLTRVQLEARVKDHLLGMGQLEGTYSR